MTTEDEMVGWHHQVNGHEFEETLGEDEEQGSLACCSHKVGHKESDTTERLNNDKHTPLLLLQTRIFKKSLEIHHFSP